MTDGRRAAHNPDGVGLGPGRRELTIAFGLLACALGALLFALRDRLGAQARAEGHGVTPLAYGVIGAILFTSGALFALSAFA